MAYSANRQWNAAYEVRWVVCPHVFAVQCGANSHSSPIPLTCPSHQAGLAAAQGKPLITLHPESISHALKEVLS